MVDNLIMPDDISIGFKGGPRFYTEKVVAVNRQKRRLPNTTIAEHVYTWALVDAPAEMVETLRIFFYDRRGDLKVFLMKDWTDFRCVECEIGIGDGVTDDFQIVKPYSAGSNPYIRVIRHIKSGTLVVKVDDVTQVPTTDYTVSDTGLITFTGGSIPENYTLITVSCEFYVPVAFEGDVFEASVPYLSPDILSVDGLQCVEDIP